MPRSRVLYSSTFFLRVVVLVLPGVEIYYGSNWDMIPVVPLQEACLFYL